MAINTANAIITTLTTVLVNAITSNTGNILQTVQSILNVGINIDSSLNATFNNVLNAITSFEGDLTSNNAIQSIISNLLMDSTVDTPFISNISPGINTYAIENASLTQPTNIPLAADGQNDTSGIGPEPLRYFGGLYPYNKVYASESGHLIEIDDTPGSERLLTQHRSGSYQETSVDGSKVDKVVGTHYHICAKNDIIHIEGAAQVDIRGAARVNIFNDADLQFGGKLNIVAKEEIRIKGSEIYIESNVGDVNILSAANVNIQSTNDMSLKSGGLLNMNSAKDTNLLAQANVNFESISDMNLLSGDDLKATSNNDFSILSSQGDIDLESSQGDINLLSDSGNIVGGANIISFQGDVIATAFNVGDPDTPNPASQAGTAIPTIPAQNAMPTNIFIDPGVIRTTYSTGGTWNTGFDEDYNQDSGPAAQHPIHKIIADNDDDLDAMQQAYNTAVAHNQISIPDQIIQKAIPANPPSTPDVSVKNPPAIPIITSTNGVETGALQGPKKISTHFTIASLSTGARGAGNPAHPIVAQHGLSVSQIVGNLSLLAINCLDKIYDKYPRMFIASGFRPLAGGSASSTSQHGFGQAADIMFHGFSNQEFLDACHWVNENLMFDQLIIERASSHYWMHVSFSCSASASPSHLAGKRDVFSQHGGSAAHPGRVPGLVLVNGPWRTIA